MLLRLIYAVIGISCLAGTGSWAQPAAYTINELVWAAPLPADSILSEGNLYKPYNWQAALQKLLQQPAPIGLSGEHPPYPLRAYVTHFSHTEHLNPEGLVYGKLKLAVSFGLLRMGDTLQLTGYSGSIGYQRSPAYTQAAELALQKLVNNCQQDLSDWLSREALQNPVLAHSVRISFREYWAEPSEDTIYYSGTQPLQWTDFKAQPLGTRYGATIFPTFHYTGNHHLRHGVLEAEVALRVYVLKHSSWVRPGQATDYALAHEQRHFDIVRLAVENFKQKVLTEDYYPEEYTGRMAYFYLETLKEINRRQEQYDRETRHGQDSAAQTRWNNQLKMELDQLSSESTGKRLQP